MLVPPRRFHQPRAALDPAPAALPWTPANLATSPIIWIDPLDASTVTKNGSNQVAQIDNKGSLSSNWTQATDANKPLHLAGNIGAGGGGVFRTSGSSQVMTWNGSAFGGAGVGFREINTNSSNATSVRADIDNAVRQVTTTPAYDLRNDSSLVMTWNPASYSAWVNGVQQNNATAATLTVSGAFFAIMNLVNGGGGSGFGRFITFDALFNIASGTRQMNGDIGPIVMLDYDPTQDERERLEGWLHHLYGVEALLPGGHPYQTNPPVA